MALWTRLTIMLSFSLWCHHLLMSLNTGPFAVTYIALLLKVENACQSPNEYSEPANYEYGQCPCRIARCSSPCCRIITLHSATFWWCDWVFFDRALREKTVDIFSKVEAPQILARLEKYARIDVSGIVSVERLTSMGWKKSRWGTSLGPWPCRGT